MSFFQFIMYFVALDFITSLVVFSILYFNKNRVQRNLRYYLYGLLSDAFSDLNQRVSNLENTYSEDYSDDNDGFDYSEVDTDVLEESV